MTGVHGLRVRRHVAVEPIPEQEHAQDQIALIWVCLKKQVNAKLNTVLSMEDGVHGCTGPFVIKNVDQDSHREKGNATVQRLLTEVNHV